MKHVFSKPVMFEGQEYAEIDIDIESMTGRDISKIKRQWAGAGNFSPVPAMDMDFCILAACHAAKLPFEFADALPAREYTGITQKVGNFLMGVD